MIDSRLISMALGENGGREERERDFESMRFDMLPVPDVRVALSPICWLASAKGTNRVCESPGSDCPCLVNAIKRKADELIGRIVR